MNLTNNKYLVDTGADLCVFFRSLLKGQLRKSDYVLHAANGTSTATYSTITLKLEIQLRREFMWRFVIADVEGLIIGIDFLSHYNLLVDPRNQSDAVTHISAEG